MRHPSLHLSLSLPRAPPRRLMVKPPPHAGFDFQGRDNLEAFQFYFRQHWICMLWPFTRAFLLTLGLGVATYMTFFAFGIEEQGLRRISAIFIFLCLLVTQYLFLLRFYRYFLHVTVVFPCVNFTLPISCRARSPLISNPIKLSA